MGLGTVSDERGGDAKIGRVECEEALDIGEHEGGV